MADFTPKIYKYIYKENMTFSKAFQKAVIKQIELQKSNNQEDTNSLKKLLNRFSSKNQDDDFLKKEWIFYAPFSF